MTNAETIKKLEKRYHVHIEKDYYYGLFTNGIRESFKIYSADGCCWDSVLNYRSLVHTLATDKKALERIAFKRMALDDSKMPRLAPVGYIKV